MVSLQPLGPSRHRLPRLPGTPNAGPGDHIRWVVVILAHPRGSDPEGQHHWAQGQPPKDWGTFLGAKKKIGDTGDVMMGIDFMYSKYIITSTIDMIYYNPADQAYWDTLW